MTEFARTRLKVSQDQIRRIPHLGDVQCAMLILRKSYAVRARFIASTSAVRLLSNVFKEWDDNLNKTLIALFCCTPSPRCFFNGAGCLGIVRMTLEHAQDRVNGWLRSARSSENYYRC